MNRAFFLAIFCLFLFCTTGVCYAGGLVDVISILQLVTGENSALPGFPAELDFNRDNKINMEDLLLALRTASAETQAGVAAGDYTLLVWNDLGMHCIDGTDYSVFSILPPYNNLHAQLIRKDEGLQRAGVRLTFESAQNLNGAWNTESATKTNFWDYADSLYGFMYGGGKLPANKGITGIFAPGRLPQELKLDNSNDWWAADGIPILPYNDDGSKRYYQLVKIKALDDSGLLLAQSTGVLPISDEMDCRKCHGSQSGYAAAKPSGGWVFNANPEKDYKLNIIRLHDEGTGTNLYSQVLAGTPVLCAKCHLSNALPGSGKPGIPALTVAIHLRHAEVIDPLTTQTLNYAANRNACYSCHPGQKTKCLRGAMGGIGNIHCQDCHGNMTTVGDPKRQGWLDEPTCQQCHQNGQRYKNAFISIGVPRSVSDRRFATNENTPLPGKELYRFSVGHHGIQCEGCHGATHAVYPSIDPEDNILATEIQSHAGTIAECVSCHRSPPKTITGGPHGLHTVGQEWVKDHADITEHWGTSSCTACHGASLRGSPLSKVFSARSFTTEWGQRTFPLGHEVSCYDCHAEPNGD